MYEAVIKQEVFFQTCSFARERSVSQENAKALKNIFLSSSLLHFLRGSEQKCIGKVAKKSADGCCKD